MTKVTLWGVRLVDWDADSLRAKDQLADVPAFVWSSRAQAEAWALSAAQERLDEWGDDNDDIPDPEGHPIRLLQDHYGAESPAGFVDYATQDRILYVTFPGSEGSDGFWVLVHPLQLDPDLG